MKNTIQKLLRIISKEVDNKESLGAAFGLVLSFIFTVIEKMFEDGKND